MIEHIRSYGISIIDSLTEGFVLLDCKYVILHSNPSFSVITGFTNEDLLGKPLAEIALTDNDKLLLSTASGSDCLSVRVRCFSGIVCQLEFSFSPMTGDDDMISGFAVLVRHASRDSIRAEHDRLNLEKYRDMALAGADWLWEIDSSGTHVYTSDSVAEFLGYSSGELFGRTPFEFMSEEESQRVASEFNRTASRNLPFSNLLNRVISKSGEERVILTSGVPVMDGNGMLKGYRGSNRDITGETATAEHLKTALASTKRIIEELPVGVIVVDSKKHVRHINRIASRITGLAPEEVSGEICHRILCPGMEGECPILDLNLSMDRNERFVIGRNGIRIPVLKTAIPIHLESEDLLLEVFTDITEMNELRNALKEKSEQLSLMHKAPEASAEGSTSENANACVIQECLMSGALNSLGRMAGYADLLKSGFPPERSEILLQSLQKAGEETLEKLLFLGDLQSLEDKAFRKDSEHFILSGLVRKIQSCCFFSCTGKDFAVETVINDSLPDLWIGPVRGLHAVLLQLLRMCFKLPYIHGILIGITESSSSPLESVLRFSITVTQRFLPFRTAEDTAEDCSRIEKSESFEKCRQFLAEVNGDLCFRNPSGGGLCLWIDIPMKKTAEIVSETLPDDFPAGKASVITVCRDPDTGRMYSMMAESMGFSGYIAEDCTGALGILREQPAGLSALIIDTDFLDGGIGALANLVRVAFSSGRTARSIIVSSLIKPGDIDRYASIGCVALLAKPLRMSTLETCLAETAVSGYPPSRLITDYTIMQKRSSSPFCLN